MSLNGTNSIISNINVGMDGYSYSCRDQISTWLWVYFKSTLYFFTALIVQPVICLFAAGRLIWAIYQCCLGRPYQSFLRFDEQGGTLFQRRLRQLNRLLIYELKLIFVYISACSTLELLKGNSIRWISMTRWLMEGSYIPTLIPTAMFECYIFAGRDYLLDTDPRFIYVIIAYPSKAILFLLMRYNEIYPLSLFTEFQILSFYGMCNTSRYH